MATLRDINALLQTVSLDRETSLLVIDLASEGNPLVLDQLATLLRGYYTFESEEAKALLHGMIGIQRKANEAEIVADNVALRGLMSVQDELSRDEKVELQRRAILARP